MSILQNKSGRDIVRFYHGVPNIQWNPIQLWGYFWTRKFRYFIWRNTTRQENKLGDTHSP